MQILKNIPDSMLHSQTLAAASNEKTATLNLLEYLAEIDSRRLYAVMGFSSLWEYVRHALGYSEAQSSERVAAMRLIIRVPEVKKELEAGNLSLTTTAKLAAHVRREKCDSHQTLELLSEVTQKTSREVERVLCAESTTSVRPDQVRVVAQKSVMDEHGAITQQAITKITIEVDQHFFDLMNRTKELGGHVGSRPQELFKMAMQEFVKRRELKMPLNKENCIKNLSIKNSQEKMPEHPLRVQDQNQSPLRAPEVKSPSRYISAATRLEIRVRAGDQCEYHDPTSDRRCNNKMNLEFDHIIPHSAGGTSDSDNLRLYCSIHNRLAAIQHFGRKKMQEYLRF